MRVYLVRHAKASREPQYTVDAERPLTDVGRADAERVAAHIARAGVTIYEIRHSGLLRAQQTADIFAGHLNPPGGVLAVAGLHHDDPVEVLARELHLETEPVMLVGHNPFMEELVGLLLTGHHGEMPVRFSTSCTVCLEHTEVGWYVRWVLDRNIVFDAGAAD
jgi:phosphohistidine phosphatase